MIDIEILRRWFESNQRDLPWRTNRTPYAVWISEVMLQQTQVAVVIPYFERWMQRFPTIQDLAVAPLDDVIKTWEGLGYYSRARNLYEGAKYIVKTHDGIFPQHAEEIKKIKGIGPYTVGAICSLAFHQRMPAVDGNVIRFLTRYYKIANDVSKSTTQKEIWDLAEAIMPDHEPWTIVEGLIEFGATICSKKPKCSICPLKKNCKAFAHGLVEKLPYKSVKTKTEFLFRSVAVIECNEHILVKREGKGKVMSDLHEFPYFEIDASGISVDQATQMTSQWLKNKLTFDKQLPEQAQSFTKYRAKLFPYKFSCNAKRLPTVVTPYQWIAKKQLSQLAFSSGHKRILHSWLF